ncbi:MAG: TonB family protein [Bacteroidales bacterium]|nr:TonB family protein [Lentimicrobiaceae bacterium]MDD5694166.1 TonB family protein [Bacteroidales bacterium]
MKTDTLIIRGLFSAALLAVSLLSNAQGIIGPGVLPPEKQPNRTSAPYFFIPSDDPSTDQLPLKSTSAEVQIAGVIADVRVTQVYKNEGQKALEAIYVFPASTRAAVYALKMTIGERTIVATIEERQKAREDYDQARQEGKTTSLLEEQRPNVFQMNVANILPGDVISVEMSYTELLIPEKGIYEFVYPTAAGPRYTNSLSGDAAWNANLYTYEGEKPLYTFDIHVGLTSPTPIKDLRSTLHLIQTRYTGNRSVEVDLADNEHQGGNRDFILQYRLSGDKLESGVLLSEGDENFFLAMIQPPRMITPDMIPPREYIFIVDVSGSMYGYPIDISKKLLKDLIGSLRPADRFNVILFAGDSRLLSDRSLPATSENIGKALRMIGDQNGSGGTEILPALEKALSLETDNEYARTFIIATDGYVSVETEVFQLIRENLGKASFFPFGIGTSVNRYIIEGIAHVGQGKAFIATDATEAGYMAERFREYVQHPVLSHIQMNFDGFDVYDVEPVSIPDVFSERPVIVFGKWKGDPTGTIRLTGSAGNTCYRQTIEVNSDGLSRKNEGLKYLWARERIRILDDFAGLGEESSLQTRITELGLRYSLLTRYTSFIAIDSRVRNAGGEQITVRQPLPLPEGVSNYAMGQAVGGVMMQGNSGKLKGHSFMSGGRIPAREAGTSGDFTVEYPSAELEPEPNEPIFTVAEVSPVFNYMGQSLEEFIARHIKYPNPWLAPAKGTGGVVYVTFVVEKEGSVSDIRVLRGLSGACDQEAVRVVKLTDKCWIPAMQRGVPVRMQMTVSVKFEER